MQAESRDIDGRKVLAWTVQTDHGTRRTWAATAEEARTKAEAGGLRVTAVTPAKSLVESGAR